MVNASAVGETLNSGVSIASCFCFLAVTPTRAKKIKLIAAWQSFIFFVVCGVGYLTLMCIVGFFSVHACISVGKKCEANL